MPTPQDLPTHKQLLRMLRYDPDTGQFHNHQGKRLDRPSSNGCRQVYLNSTPYLAHRLAWYYQYGEWPDKPILHLNETRSDNRLSNLQEATTFTGSVERFNPSTPLSGYLGVSWHARDHCWQAHIGHQGKSHHIGYFSTPEAARDARLRKEKALRPWKFK